MIAIEKARLLLLTLWAGSIWTVGYLVAPTLFATLADRALAGTVAANVFHSQAWLSIGCGAVVTALLWLGPKGVQRKWLLGLALAMLLCTLVVHFGLQPQMRALREAAGPGGVMESAHKARFGMLHGVSAVIYLLQSVMAGALVLKHQSWTRT